MNSGYDEIISDNPFFIELRNDYNNLYQHVISQSWIVCVPRIGSLNTRVFTIEDLCAHILIPDDELPETHYRTLTEKQVTVTNKVITLEVTKGLPLQSHILFEEIFYTEDFNKYKIWCIETPLEPSFVKSDNAIGKEYLTSLNDCIELLWTQSAGRQVLEQIEHCVQNFMKKHRTLPVALSSLKNVVGELYTQCIQIAFQNRRLREKSQLCRQISDNIKLAVETYMQQLIFNVIFKSICTCASYEDSHLNKTIRNLSDIQLRDLDVRKDLYHAVPKSKQILSTINTYNTVLEKMVCFKNALNAIKKSDKAGNSTMLLTADDMLPVFVFLVIKSGLPNWYSQLMYMKEFRFCTNTKGDADECAFLLTTLEAVIEHIQSGALLGSPNPESLFYENDFLNDNVESAQPINNSTMQSENSNSSEQTLEHIFELIKASHYTQIHNILSRNQKHLNDIQYNLNGMIDLLVEPDNSDDDYENDNETTLCHPLCNCKKCCKVISRKLLKTSPTVMSRDTHGLTPLHIASIHGKADIVDLLIEIGAEIDASDLNESTSLHYAASRGHQNALLLLLHSGADINHVNIDKNTPLHMCVNNGHISCVKALIYFAENARKKLLINSMNRNGDSPLHLASKWGYEGIAKLLIENGAEPSLQNRKNKSAFDYAHNLRILQILKSCTPNLYEYIHITIPELKELKCKSENDTNKQQSPERITSNEIPSSVENLKRIDRILKAISYGDIKLACFYMNIDYSATYSIIKSKSTKSCHPLCNCESCKNKTKIWSSDFDVNSSDTQGHTALHLAARYGFDDLCNILLLNKANVNCVNKNCQTPLHFAALSNKVSTLRLLLENGASVNAINSAGNTALHDASQMGNVGAVKTLLLFGPDITIVNASAMTALDIAREKVHLTVIDLVDKYMKNMK